MKTFLSKRSLAGAIIALGFASAVVIVNAQASPGSSSVSLKKDTGTGFFVLTVRASAGIQKFALYPPNKSPYGGEMSCQTVYKNELVAFADPDDFTPKMGATITDCNGNSTDFDLLPPKNGATVGKPTVAPSAENPAAAQGEKSPAPQSQILANVKFPVKELNNCQSEAECISYCDDAAHAEACLDFAQKNKILSEDEVASRKKLADVTDGPGGCNSQKSCEAYCSDVSKLDECFSFAEKHNLLSAQELNKIGKIKSAIQAGAKLPGGCSNQKSCEVYCNNAEHMDECLAFGEQSGFLDSNEIQQYRKFAELQKSGQTPGKCTSKDSCEAYCNGPDNAEECVAFAEKAGFLSGEELEQVKKVLPLLKEGKTPGGCRSKQQCEAYCAEDSHTDECIEFGLKAGMISSKDAEIIKKTGGKGPGGCHGRDECQKYCEQNQEECMNWAKENGLEGQFAGPGGCKNQEECVTYCKANPEDDSCKKMMQEFGGGAGGPGGQGRFSGPGGCRSQEECMAYCKDHQEECQGFAPPGTGGPGSGLPGSSGRGDSQSRNGFSDCGIVNGAVADYVCGINGKSRGVQTEAGVEVTYFNECHARQQGAEILHKGVCVRKGGPDVPCSNVAHPVCGTDGNSWTHECNAKEAGAEVKHEGVCTNEDLSGNNGGGYSGGTEGGTFSGPGGCKTEEECTAYCTKYPDKCQGMPPQTGGGQQYPQTTPPAGQIPQDYCQSFVSVPKCEYVGSPDSQGYKYCKQCFPDK